MPKRKISMQENFEYRLFVCVTPMQFVSCLNVIDANSFIGDRFVNDLILFSYRFRDNSFFERVKQLGIFRTIIVVDDIRYWLLGKNLDESKRYYPRFNFLDVILYKLHFFRKKIRKKYIFQRLKCIRYEVAKYCEIYYYGGSYVLQYLKNLVSDKNRFHVIDEGISTYVNGDGIKDAGHVHVYDLDLIQFNSSQLQVHALQRINHDRKRLLQWLNSIYTDMRVHIEPKSILYLDQNIKLSVRRKAVEWIYKRSVKMNANLYVRLHPASNLSEFNLLVKKCPRIILNESSPCCPLEICFLLNKSMPTEIYTLFSSGALYWRLMFDSDLMNSKIVIMKNFFSLIPLACDERLQAFFRKFNEKYPHDIELM